MCMCGWWDESELNNGGEKLAILSLASRTAGRSAQKQKLDGQRTDGRTVERERCVYWRGTQSTGRISKWPFSRSRQSSWQTDFYTLGIRWLNYCRIQLASARAVNTDGCSVIGLSLSPTLSERVNDALFPSLASRACCGGRLCVLRRRCRFFCCGPQRVWRACDLHNLWPAPRICDQFAVFVLPIGTCARGLICTNQFALRLYMCALIPI
jgi:hypothetical protein